VLTQPSDDRTSEGGFTLVELLVVLVLMGVVGGVVTSAITTGLRSASATTTRTLALHDIEVALQRVGRDLRAADPLYLTSGSDYTTELGAEYVRDRHVNVVRFATEVGADGIQRLVQTTTLFDLDDVAAGSPTPISAPQRVLVTDIDNGLQPIFRYFGADGIEILCTPDVAGETKATCDDRYAEAAEVSIRLVRNVPGQQPINAETRVNVRNTRYGSATP
jgi:prepilin-type N-terminal cleavage/methylation domain-containing protein